MNSVVFEREKEEKKERMEGKSLKSRESGFETLINLIYSQRRRAIRSSFNWVCIILL